MRYGLSAPPNRARPRAFSGLRLLKSASVTAIVALMAATIVVCALWAHHAGAVTVHNVPASTSTMVCASEAEQQIAAALDSDPDESPQHTWSDHLYTCRYHFPDGTLVVSVKELPDVPAATAFFASRASATPGHRPVSTQGQEAFVAPTGYTVVRKDSSVLMIDVSGLPDAFGPHRLSHVTVATAVAIVIMGCWSGS